MASIYRYDGSKTTLKKEPRKIDYNDQKLHKQLKDQ